MIGTQLFRRHFTVTVVVISVFLAAGVSVSNWVMRYSMSHAPVVVPTEGDVFFARLIEDSQIKDRVKAVEHLDQISGGSLPFKLVILNADGNPVDPKQSVSLSWSEIQKPQTDFEVKIVRTFDKLIRLPGTPVQYLYTTRANRRPPGMPGLPPPGVGLFDPSHPGPGHQGGPRGPMGPPPHPPLLLVLSTFGVLVTFVLIGIGLSLYLIFRSVRQKISQADTVISELQNGNLKARMPIHRLDEFGLAMLRFNKMAEEIERLVERLRKVEKSRMILLQDLTHDLRTPVASLKNLLVTIEKKNLESDQAVRAELLSISRKEVEYTERLVEDLLVLAQISEPRYQANLLPVSISALLQEESERLTKKGSLSQKTVELTGVDEALVSGDEHLLRRLIRNALENALSFAKTRVHVSLEIVNEESLRILVSDDGPGLSGAALDGFGERRVSRVMAATEGNRLSVGLGSVIMKTVAEIHSGKMAIRNQLDESGKVTGAELIFVFPIRSALTRES